MALLQRRLENGLRQTLSVLLGSAVSALAWERAKLPTCFGGLGISEAQIGICCASQVPVGRRLAQGRHAEHLRCAAQTAPGSPGPICSLLESQLMTTPGCSSRVTQGLCMRQALGLRTRKLLRSSARHLCRWLTESRQRVLLVTWPTQSSNRGSCLQLKWCRRPQNSTKLSCSVRVGRTLARIGQPCTSLRQRCYRTRNGGWPRRCGWARRSTLGRAPLAPCAKAATEMCEHSPANHAFRSFCCNVWEEPGSDRIKQSCARCTGALSKLEGTRTWSAMCQSSTIW